MKGRVQFTRAKARKVKCSREGNSTVMPPLNCIAYVSPPKAGGSLGLKGVNRPPRRSSSRAQPSPCIETIPGISGGLTAIICPDTVPRIGIGLSGSSVLPPENVACTFSESSFQLEKIFNASSKDTVMFLMLANQWGFEFAAYLAKGFHWKLNPSLPKLRATWKRLTASTRSVFQQ